MTLMLTFFDFDVYFTLTLTLTKNGEEKGGKHLEEENIWSTEEKKNSVLTKQLTNQANIDQSAFSKVRK